MLASPEGAVVVQVGYGGRFETPALVAATGATVANLHQGIAANPDVKWPGHTAVDEGMLNPYINWPFEPASVGLMGDWAAEAKGIGLRTKFYYTVRELSNHVAGMGCSFCC